MSANLLNFAAYQVAWFACVLSAAAGMPWIGAIVAVAVVTIHVARAARPRAEFELVAAASAIGLVVDSALTSAGLLSFSTGVMVPGWAPYWMVALWAAFATTLNRSLHWLTSRPLLAAIFGALGGPLAYLAGAELGALDMSSSQPALLAIGVAWAVALWVLALIAARLNAKASVIPAASLAARHTSP